MELTELVSDPTAEPGELAAAVDNASEDPTAYGTVLDLVGHYSPQVRTAVARTLPHLASREQNAPFLAFAVDALLSLTADPDQDVRNWACFGLGTQLTEIDGPQIREALAARLTDGHGEARREALVGLARRRDPRALAAARRALSRSEAWLSEIEAAGALGDPSLHPLVRRHADGWDGNAGRVVSAALRLTDPAGLGEDLADGVAALFRENCPGPDRRGPGWWRVALDVLDLAPYRAPELVAAIDARLEGDEPARTALRRSALGHHATDHGWEPA